MSKSKASNLVHALELGSLASFVLSTYKFPKLWLRAAIAESSPEEPTAMSVKNPLALGNDEAVKGDGDVNAKRRRFDSCFSFMEISMEPGSTLKDLDSDKLKTEIKRWAKAVVAYARQHADDISSGSEEDEELELVTVQCTLRQTTLIDQDGGNNLGVESWSLIEVKDNIIRDGDDSFSQKEWEKLFGSTKMKRREEKRTIE